MKKLVSYVALSALSLGASAQMTGRIEVYDFDTFKLHVYYTNDVMADASYIVEGANELVTMEQPLFKVNIAEFDAYLNNLGKKVAARISDYHVGGTADNAIVMAEGMPAFSKGPIYGGMMQGFAAAFGDTITDLPTGSVSEVKFDSVETWAGVTFDFSHGASSDFPAASILIGKSAYYTHWAPAKSHMSHLQVSSPAAVDAELAESKKALASGAELFIGGHGGAADASALRFKVEYLNTVKALLAKCDTADKFVEALNAAYPELPGNANLKPLADALYTAK